MRNIFAKLPRLMQGKMKLLVQQVFLALTYAAALKRERDLIAKFTDRYPAAIEGLERDLEECVTYLRFPEAHYQSKHWRGIPMTAAMLQQLQWLRAVIAVPTKEEALA